AGFYDKFYAHSSKEIYKIALAFSCQIIDEVPADRHDIPVDCIVTEKGLIICSR
ncbi:MAG: putative 5-formyltetrahydrofolate cyclo-ligase, partial [Clostridia bacterium]|nr:putative 5-formyltetrahydrofolate cyclo-ligase [Clostridia bacterium]